jgi:hypothetical protein
MKLHPAPPPDTRAVAPDARDEDPVRACGWFDSSHDLLHGLVVQEHEQPDAVAADLPLGAWLALHVMVSRRAGMTH